MGGTVSVTLSGHNSDDRANSYHSETKIPSSYGSSIDQRRASSSLGSHIMMLSGSSSRLNSNFDTFPKSSEEFFYTQDGMDFMGEEMTESQIATLRENLFQKVDNIKISKQGELKRVNNYVIHKQIGSGIEGVVYKAVKYSGNIMERTKSYAIKVIDRKKMERNNFAKYGTKENVVLNEIENQMRLRHQNILPIVEVLEDHQDRKTYIVFPLVKGDVLGQDQVQIQPLGEMECKDIFVQLIDAMYFMHNMNIAHLDIKPSNIMRQPKNGNIFLVDFGNSKRFESYQKPTTDTTLGTSAFAAPETYKAASYDAMCADVWSAGVTLYQLVYGKLPFLGENELQLGEQIGKASFRLEKQTSCVSCTPTLVDFLSKMLERDPAKRSTLKQLWNHPWLTNEATVM